MTACLGETPEDPLTPFAAVEFSGDVKAADDLSGVATLGGLLVIGADEAVGANEDENIIQLLAEDGNNRYRVQEDIVLFKGEEDNGKEMDIEGIAAEGSRVYVIGSHSARRRRIKASKNYETNRESFRESEISAAKDRGWLYRLEFDADGGVTEKHRVSLRDIIGNDETLKAMMPVPSKENGVDIEGIAAQGESLYLGFRGPVFRGNWVPVMKLKFEDPRNYRLLYVDLGGRGIRDITRVSDGFLLIAGPVGDGSASYRLYHWDGNDMLPGEDRKPTDIGRVRLLGEIDPSLSADLPAQAKPEGIAVLGEEGAEYELIVVYDSAPNGGAQRFRVPKPIP